MLDTAEMETPIDPIMKRGMKAHEAQNHLTAAKIFEIACRRDPSAIAAILNMGSSYYKAKHYSEAEDAFREALRREPDNAAAHYGLAMLYEEIGDRPAARARFQKAAELNPNSGKAWLSLAQVTLEETPRLQALHRAADWAKSQLQNERLTAKGALEACYYLQQAHLYTDGLKAAQIALQLDLGSHKALSGLRSCYLNLHDYAAAADVIRRMIMECELQHTRKKHDKAFAEAAQKTLIEIQKTLDAADVPFFLVAGTLLGCIRDHGPLEYDRDVDIGIMGDVSNKTVIEALRANTDFICPLSYSEDDIYLGFTHGLIGVDIFRYELNGDYVWCGFDRHPGSLKWRFTPFGLKQQMFFGLPFLTPDNPSRYLRESYGDWENPDIGFSSVLSSPARFDTDNEYLRYISYSRLWFTAHKKDIALMDYVFKQTPNVVRKDSALYERLTYLTESD